MFTVDAVDEDEAMGYFGSLTKEFIRTKVAPEMDAWTIASIAGKSNIGGTTGTLSTGADVVAALRAGTNTMDEAEVPEDDRVLFITPTLIGAVEDTDTTKSREILERFNTIVRIPQSRFYSVIDLYDGTSSGETAGGYIKDASSGKDMNFMIVSKSAIVKFTKHLAPKIVTPEQNQTADAWKYGYRVVALCNVLDNKVAGVYAHHKA
ncbi:MAG: hypothetical protein KBS75_09335 [Bacteroidales bacterium]|nr:hypothetical protein [Candidatus Equimonas faecalis]